MSTVISPIEKRLLKQFRHRKKKSSRKGYTIDDSLLYAGSPMHYYCRHCGIHTETLPENHMSLPNTVCNGCTKLEELALI